MVVQLNLIYPIQVILSPKWIHEHCILGHVYIYVQVCLEEEVSRLCMLLT